MGKEQNEQIEQEEEFEVSNFLRQDLPIEIVESNLLSILLNTGSQELFFKAHEKITLNHFSNAFHSRIYKYIYNMVIVDSSPIDKALIASKIRQQGQRKQYDKIIGEKPPVEHFDYYLVAIDKDFKIRRFKEIIFQRSTNFYEDKEIDVNLEIERLESDILAMVSSNQSSVLSMGDIVPEVLASIRSKKFLAELEFPLVRINEMLYGVQPCYYIIAARPSMGKSLMSLDIALHNVEKGHKGLFFSLEMPKDSIIKRAIARAAKIPHFRIRKGDLTDEEVSLIEKAGNRIKSYPLHIDDTAGLSASEIVARTKRFAIRNPDLKFVMVDYMQIVSESGSGGGTREREVSKISAAFKTLSKNMGIPVIVLSQLSREVEKRQDKRPILSDLRDCLAVDTSFIYTEEGVKQNSSEDMNLLSLNHSERIIIPTQSKNIPKTENTVYRIKTKSGRFIDCTKNHSILTNYGYKRLEEISMTDSLVIACNWKDKPSLPQVPIENLSTDTYSDAQRILSEAASIGWIYGIREPAYLDPFSPGHHSYDIYYMGDIPESYKKYFDQVDSISYLGVKQVFDRSVPSTNNYIVNGIIVHNSGSVEQDADVVMFLYSDNYYNNREANIWTTEIILAKHRNGQTGTVLAYSLQDYQTFAEFNGGV